MDYEQMSYDALQRISETLLTIAKNQSALNEELANVNNSIQEISQTGAYSIKDISDKLDSVDFQLTIIDSSINSIA